jgi:heterodisulfide reductase subunit A2
MRKKIGVYVCHCGGNISDYVDVEKVRQAVEKEDGVFLAKTTMFACADSNQNQMIDDIKEQGLDSVIVASCSPKLHLLTFRAVTERAGLNKYNYVHANIREQVSWAHSNNKAGATEKAVQIVKAAIAKVRFSKALAPIQIASEKAVAVIGAGVSGMRSAIELANMGARVYLVEKSHFTGGRVSQWGKLNPDGTKGKELTNRLYHEIIKHDKITLLTGSELSGLKGSIGNFTLHVKIAPSFIKGTPSAEQFQKVVEVCPVEVEEEFNFGLTKRKAIYVAQNGQFPKAAAIDKENCTKCGQCENVFDGIDLMQKEETIELQVGTVLVATGFDPYTPADGEYGYGQIPNVVTLPQFIRMVDMQDGKLFHTGHEIKNIAYIYCVGSRQSDGENKYCSRYCCTTTIFNAIQVRKKFGNINNFHLTRGVRTYGKQELMYNEASKNGDIFLQFSEDAPPILENRGSKTIVKIKDILTHGEELEIDADLVVLVTGMVPKANDSIGNLLKIPRGRDNFFNEIHMKLRPVETVIDGITIAGTCQGPKNSMESIHSGLAASIKSFNIINKGTLELEPIVAKVNPDSCTWCGECSTACPFDAIQQKEENGKNTAQINISVCKGCGMCLPLCPSDSIELVTYTNKEVESMIDSLITL